MKARWVLPLLLVCCALVALLVLAWSRRRPATVEAARDVPVQPVPPAGDPMPVLRPRQGLDTGMPVIQFDSAGRRRARTSHPGGTR